MVDFHSDIHPLDYGRALLKKLVAEKRPSPSDMNGRLEDMFVRSLAIQVESEGQWTELQKMHGIISPEFVEKIGRALKRGRKPIVSPLECFILRNWRKLTIQSSGGPGLQAWSTDAATSLLTIGKVVARMSNAAYDKMISRLSLSESRVYPPKVTLCQHIKESNSIRLS